MPTDVQAQPRLLCTWPCDDAPPVIGSANIIASVAINLEFSLVSILSDPGNNLDLSTLEIVKQPSSKATANIVGDELVIKYSEVPLFAGTDSLTIKVCDTDAVCTQKIIVVEVDGDITIYNGVSPNGDNKNDIFTIKNIGILQNTKNNKVTIYHRWGDVVSMYRTTIMTHAHFEA